MLTVGELKRHLDGYNDDDELGLPGGLTFSRLKRRGTDLVMLEVGEVEASLSNRFKSKFPEIKVAFCKFESTGEIIREVFVPEL